MDYNHRLTLRNVNKNTLIGTVNILIDFYSPTSRKQLFLKTSVKVNKIHWDNKNQIVRKTNSSHSELNEKLKNAYNEVLKLLNELKHNGIDITPESIKDRIEAKKELKEEGLKDLVKMIKEYINLRPNLKIRMIQKLENLITRIDDFQKIKRKGKSLFANDLDQTFVNDFEKYLQTEYPNHENKQLRKSQNPATIFKTFKLLRQVLKYYSDRGKIKDSYKQLIYPQNVKVKQMILVESEIKQFLSFIPPNKRLEKVKDLAMLQLYTGLRFSDAIKLNESDVYNESLNITTKKTDQPISIPLHPALKILLKKYEGNFKALKISNVKYNDYLKELFELAGIDSKTETVFYVNGQKVTKQEYKHRLVSSHSFRRAFVTNAILAGIPLSVIQSITGHTTITQLNEYAIIADEIKKQEMNKLNSLFSVG